MPEATKSGSATSDALAISSSFYLIKKRLGPFSEVFVVPMWVQTVHDFHSSAKFSVGVSHDFHSFSEFWILVAVWVSLHLAGPPFACS
jgi:hypothetical protein